MHGAQQPPPAAGTPLTRRVVLKAGGGLLLSAVIPLSGCGSSAPPGTPGSNGPTPRARFFTDAERATLRALVDRLIPEDTDPGAAAAACEEAIDALLAAFLTDPPLIYAGAPFSDRGGAPHNDFLAFIPLDEYEARAWRLYVEGSNGDPALEFNGPVVGRQQLYRDGLARLDERAAEMGFASFAEAPAQARDLIIRDSSDAVVQALVDAAFPDTVQAMYGAPEYGGNRDLVGWGFTAYDGDVQPRGYTAEQVINADNPGPLDFLLPPSFSEPDGGVSLPAAGLPAANAATDAGLPLVVSSETMAQLTMDAQGSLRRAQARLQPLAQALARLREGGGHA